MDFTTGLLHDKIILIEFFILLNFESISFVEGNTLFMCILVGSYSLLSTLLQNVLEFLHDEVENIQKKEYHVLCLLCFLLHINF